jgi:hypothetical protein
MLCEELFSASVSTGMHDLEAFHSPRTTHLLLADPQTSFSLGVHLDLDSGIPGKIIQICESIYHDRGNDRSIVLVKINFHTFLIEFLLNFFR